LKSLIDQELFLKPIKFRDKSKWDEVRANNQEWLSPWEATRPLIDRKSPLPSYYGMIMQLNKEMRALRSISLGIWLKENGNQHLIGQQCVGRISDIGLTRDIPIGGIQLEL
jgi:ribosomal-protein-alanine N-acetyltransferase